MSLRRYAHFPPKPARQKVISVANKCALLILPPQLPLHTAAAPLSDAFASAHHPTHSHTHFLLCTSVQLEILPAARLAITPAAGILQKTQASIFSSALNSKSGSSKVNRIPPGKNAKNTNCTNSRNSHGGGGGGGGGSDAVTRALAALPKGVRFSSPKMADKSRAANRRRLAASARAVANNRWAAQLGYQDGVEHIRDLK